mmetsp:Transcript_63365/g.185248  ORF Transcript_63365/g.185248 Transcript_63365/m.185248 type:complete len:730 (-) Transcript_63365:79-2268(-)
MSAELQEKVVVGANNGDDGGVAWVSALPVGMAPSPDGFGAGLSACMVQGHWERAIALVHEMQVSEVVPEVHVFNRALRACADAQQWHHALGLLDQMQELGLAPDAASFDIVSSTCHKRRQWDRTARLLNDMQHTGLASASRGLEHGILACAESTEWARALGLLVPLMSSADGLRLDSRRACIATVMMACLRGSRWEHALQLFEDVRCLKLAPDGAEFSAALAACGRGRQSARALALLEEIRFLGIEVNTQDLNSVISACEKDSRWEEALWLMHQMQTVGPPPDARSFAFTIHAVAKGFGVGTDDTRRWAWSLALLQQMMCPEVGSVHRIGAVPTAQTWAAVVAACSRARKWNVALTMLSQMEASGVQPCRSVVHSALTACERGSCWEGALALLEHHWHVATSMGSLPLSTTMLACENAGAMHAVGAECFKKLQDFAYSNILGGIAELGRTTGVSRSGDRDWALQMAFSPFAHTLLMRNDFMHSRNMGMWRRWAQRPVEQSLRMLHASSDFAARLPDEVRDEKLRNINDLWPEMTAYAFAALGMGGIDASRSPHCRTAMRRTVWWQIQRLPKDPEGYYVAAFLQYAIVCKPGNSVLRCPGKVVRWHDWRAAERCPWEAEADEPCRYALAPVNMVKDRLQHRGWHAERMALLALTFRIVSRHRHEEAGKVRCGQASGTVWLHAAHTPCMSCTASICQFQALFRRLRLTVTFDVWERWRPAVTDPWSASLCG